MIKQISLLFGILFTSILFLKIDTIYSTSDGLPDNLVRSIYNDPTGDIWAGTSKGTARFSQNGWKLDKQDSNPVTGGVSSIFKDSKGNFWFGGLGSAHWYDGIKYQSFSIVNDMLLQGRVVFSFHEDTDKNIWIATTGGAAIYNGSNWTTMTSQNGLNNNVIHDIAQDDQDRYWFATRRGGLNIFDGTQWEYLYTNMNCRKILKDNIGNMWVGSNDGIIKYDGNEWKIFEEGKTLIPMFQGDKNLIWCTTGGPDIIRISSEGKTIEYKNITADKADEIFYLEKGHDGDVWAGTNQGIFVFN